MTALRDAIDTTTLGWIKPEIDETLRQARGEIEAFAENPADTTLMRACASFLHQVHGTLRMVELYAPAMVAEEMERLAHALVVPQGAKGAVADRDEACGALMRGVVLLPDYLERLQGGHKDIPIVLLPLLNELRAARGETGLSESVLFVPNLDRPLPDSLPAPMPLPRQSRQLMAAQQLTALREALATWPEDGTPANIVGIAKAIDGLLESADHEATRRMLWVASSVATALRDGALPPTRALRQAFSGVEREARHIFEGEAAASVRVDPGTEPTRQLLYHVAHNEQAHGALDALRDTFDLAAQLPTESELAHARGSLSGRNRALLDTVAAAIKEDLLRVKDALDLHLRTKQTGVADLHPQVEALGRTADTLGMMGLGVARNVVLQQRDAMHDIVSGARPADEGALLDIAGALLYVDASLDDQVDRLGRPSEGEEADTIASESRKVLDVLVREAIANFADARQAFVAFVETSWDHAQLTDVPRLLEEVAGALRILELPQPAQYLAGVRRFTENELLGRRRVPNGQQLDTLADALASIEYYLEALRDQRPNRDNILDIARQSLESLRYWPLPDETAKPSVLADATLSEPVVDASQFDAPAADARTEARTEAPAAAPVVSAPTAPVAPAPAAAPVATGARGGFEATGDEIDDEIREVFLEEFEEEIGHLEQMVPGWRARPEDMEKLRPIRRVFHTLKGSGRLVGARTLGEFSWKVENMLNRVLDGTRPASPAVVALVDHAFYTLPALHAALRGDAPLTADLSGIEAVAERDARRRNAGRRAGDRRGGSRCARRRRIRRADRRRHRRPGAARNPRRRSQRPPGHHRCMARAGAVASGRGQRWPAARDAHHERCVRDDRSAGHHQRHRPGRNLHPSPARRACAADRRRRRRTRRDRRRDPPHRGRTADHRAARALAGRPRTRSGGVARHLAGSQVAVAAERTLRRSAGRDRPQRLHRSVRRSAGRHGPGTAGNACSAGGRGTACRRHVGIPRPRRRDPGRWRPADQRDDGAGRRVA